MIGYKKDSSIEATVVACLSGGFDENRRQEVTDFIECVFRDLCGKDYDDSEFRYWMCEIDDGLYLSRFMLCNDDIRDLVETLGYRFLFSCDTNYVRCHAENKETFDLQAKYNKVEGDGFIEVQGNKSPYSVDFFLVDRGTDGKRETFLVKFRFTPVEGILDANGVAKMLREKGYLFTPFEGGAR